MKSSLHPTKHKVTRYLVTLCAFGMITHSSFADTTAEQIVKLQTQSENGDAESQFQLAKYYFSGKGVAEDQKKAFELTSMAAKQNHAEALTNLGFFYSKGLGVEKNPEAAMEAFRKASDLGSLNAKLNIGLLIRKGEGAEKSNEESIKFLQEAVDGGLPEAKATLGQLYFLGDSLMRKDYAKAFPLLLESADAGNAGSQNMLALIYRDGYGGVPKDETKAREYFTKAAKQNDLKSQSNLARMMGVELPSSPDRKEALTWLLIASEQGDVAGKKLLDIAEPTVPTVLMLEAKKAASRFILLQGAKKKQKKGQESESDTVETKVNPDKQL